METMREAWTDRRLDRLSHKVGELERHIDLRFDQVDERFDEVKERFSSIDSRFDRLEANFQSFQRSVLQLGGVVIAALIGFIATAQIF